MLGFTKTCKSFETNTAVSMLRIRHRTDHCENEEILADMKLSDNQFVADMEERPSRSFWDESDFPLNIKFSSITAPPVVAINSLGERVVIDNGHRETTDN